MLLLPAEMLGDIVKKGKLNKIQPLLPVLVLHLDMMDLPPRLLLPLYRLFRLLTAIHRSLH